MDAATSEARPLGYVWRKNAPPEGDVVFSSVGPAGDTGPFHLSVLRKLGLSESDLPSPIELSLGYSFLPTGRQTVCFVVTRGSPSTADVLDRNLRKALLSLTKEPVRSLWIPLMGTGGGLSPADSFAITVRCLTETGWLSRPDVTVTISGTTAQPPRPRTKRDAPPPKPDPKPPVKPGASGGKSRQGPSDPSAPPYPPPMTPAAAAVLQLATAIGLSFQRPKRAVSSTLLFFALAESQSAAAASALRDDLSAKLFAGAIQAVAASRYRTAWDRYAAGGSSRPWTAAETLLPPTANVSVVLGKAQARARARDSNEIEVDDLIVCLLTHEDGRFIRVTDTMGGADRLLDEYVNARAGEVVLKLFNDVASDTDNLGYDRYAEAIWRFLVHEHTPPPISISIQAPWGAGKSSLMKLLRNKLDPPEARREPEPESFVDRLMDGPRRLARVLRLGRSGPAAELPPPAPRHLTLGKVQAFLNGRKMSPRVKRPPSGRRWTVWFNAWKYESSEQVWAGLVDAIVSEVSSRLAAADRELFLLRLHLSRIDDGKVRRRIYDRVFSLWWGLLQKSVLAGVLLVGGAFGLKKAEGAVPLPHWLAELLKPLAEQVGWSIAAVVGAMAALSYLVTLARAKTEKADYSLAEYIKVPDYSAEAGSLHEVQEDLKRVLDLVPRGQDNDGALVIFIDDLDRCPPSKVVNVVEGVSYFLGNSEANCMFVIGLDPQMVAAALETAHKDVLASLPPYERTVPMGWRFMDKFIQLPFTIPPPRTSELETFLERLDETPPKPPEHGLPGPPSLRLVERLDGIAYWMGGLFRRVRPTPAEEPPEPTGASGQTAPGPEMENPATPISSGESRDVGRILQQLHEQGSGNPRELKRMANLARFYLQLRNERQRQHPAWRAPDIDQYARWIALASRWPDMMRWLLWGADEANWTIAEVRAEPLLMARRLKVLEKEAKPGRRADHWIAAVGKRLNIPHEEPADWVRDVRLHEFFVGECRFPEAERISAAVKDGFV